MTRPCATPGCPNPVERKAGERRARFEVRKHCSRECSYHHQRLDMLQHEAELRRLAEQGMGPIAAARELGIGADRVKNWFTNLGLFANPRGPLRYRAESRVQEIEPAAEPALRPSPRSIRAYEQAPACERAFFAEHIRQHAEQRMRIR